MEPINLKEKFNKFNDYWHPRIIARLNGQEVRIAKLKGPFIWHQHKHEDELFLVIKGILKIEFRDRTVTIHEGEMFIVPRGTEHRPVAEQEVHVLLFEPADTKHTGDVIDERTIDIMETI